jgi:hypothetical protein
MWSTIVERLTPVSSSESAMSQADTAARVKQWLKFIHKVIFTALSNDQYSVEHESHRRRQSRRKITVCDIQWIGDISRALYHWILIQSSS